jgi:hypothetical protein
VPTPFVDLSRVVDGHQQVAALNGLVALTCIVMLVDYVGTVANSHRLSNMCNFAFCFASPSWLPFYTIILQLLVGFGMTGLVLFGDLDEAFKTPQKTARGMLNKLIGDNSDLDSGIAIDFGLNYFSSTAYILFFCFDVAFIFTASTIALGMIHFAFRRTRELYRLENAYSVRHSLKIRTSKTKKPYP